VVAGTSMSWRALVVGFCVALALGCEKKTPPVAIGSATSLRAAMPKLIDAYEASHPGHDVVATYAASGELRNQVLAGAPLDALCLAGATPLDDLIKAGRVDPGSRQVLASYNLVLVGRRGGAPLTFDTLVSALPPGERLAVGDPRTVPAGEYARDYLRAKGVWDALQPRLVMGANVAAVLAYARRGEAVGAIVYDTELHGLDDLVELDTAKGAEAPHPKVVAGTVSGGREEGAQFLRFIASPSGQKVLGDLGFGPP
jgi:molybdate transport system substrate-binding protein